jgi:hypothetical protein
MSDLDLYNIVGIQLSGKIIPIADIMKKGILLKKEDYLKISREKIVPKMEDDKIKLETDVFEIVSIYFFLIDNNEIIF